MMRRDILLHFYYRFGSSAGIAKVPRGGGGEFPVYNSLTGSCGMWRLFMEYAEQPKKARIFRK